MGRGPLRDGVLRLVQERLDRADDVVDDEAVDVEAALRRSDHPEQLARLRVVGQPERRDAEHHRQQDRVEAGGNDDVDVLDGADERVDVVDLVDDGRHQVRAAEQRLDVLLDALVRLRLRREQPN
jgi:hypothetical protein